MSDVTIRPIQTGDKSWIIHLIKDCWFSDTIVAHGTVYSPHDLPGFIAVQGKKNVGLITYQIEGDQCEIVSLNSIQPSLGIGTILLHAVITIAQQKKCQRVWLVTTNDNMNALRFYQKRGFSLFAIHRNELEHSRKLKPEIPMVGENDIPLRDEIELEMILCKNP